MKIREELRQLRNNATRAIELFDAIGVHHADDRIDALIELCAEIISTENYSDTDIAIEVAGMLSAGDDENTFVLDVPSDTEHTIRWDDDEGWVEIDE